MVVPFLSPYLAREYLVWDRLDDQFHVQIRIPGSHDFKPGANRQVYSLIPELNCERIARIGLFPIIRAHPGLIASGPGEINDFSVQTHFLCSAFARPDFGLHMSEDGPLLPARRWIPLQDHDNVARIPPPPAGSTPAPGSEAMCGARPRTK
jgi:hypothetical protein